MEALEAIRKRCSVREFKDTMIPGEAIEKIVDSGRVAPTARGEEPWEFIVVTDKQMLKTLADIADYGKFIKSSACAIVVVCKDTKYYLEDGCAATENMLIASSSLGIGSCWVAGDKKSYCPKVLEALKVPSGYKLVSMVAFGYPLKEPKPPEKRQLEEVLHREKF